ncbi:MAG TPA: ABC transporter substrate binding protein, partial [Ramlibacter sp.]|jgi:putative ABC transport system substrate-binding protein|nr:ABC transporter substrate binding protein [Ramlibacter sp.]
VLLNESNPSHPMFWSTTVATCTALNLDPVRIIANAPTELPGAFSQAARAQAQGVVVVADGMFLNERTRIGELVRASRLPAAFGLREHVLAGGLVSYASDLRRNHRHAASFADKILRGARPGLIPVEQPLKFDLAINLAAARSLAITIPQSVLIRADELVG